ncbi:MAG: radical SAM protein, partial [Thermodesulfobacteriota bacterium]|nr:radical SAM protein [Thermodesulfobacteriota bacterium]
MSCDIEDNSRLSLGQKEAKWDLPEGVPPLTSLYLYISGSCNLACRHCWITPAFQEEGNGGRHVKVEYVEKAIREARPLGLHSVKLTGGEPMLHPRFRDIVRMIDEEGFSIQVETNGTLLDQKIAEFLKQAQNLSFVSVSVDGATAESHEELRGVRGSFKGALAGIRNLVKQGFRPQLICTLHKGNSSEVAKVIEMAEGLGCGSVKFNHVQEVGRGERFAEERGLGVLELVNLYRFVEDYLMPKSKIHIHFDIPLAFYPIRKLINDPLSRCMVRNILGILDGG